MSAIAVETATDELAEIYATAQEHFGQVPSPVKALGANPTFCTSITNFMIQALAEGRVTWEFNAARRLGRGPHATAGRAAGSGPQVGSVSPSAHSPNPSKASVAKPSGI